MHTLLLYADDTFGYLFFSTITFFVGIFITRAVFSISTIVGHLKAQTRLMVNIAEKLGVDHEEIKGITSEVKDVNYAPTDNTNP